MAYSYVEYNGDGTTVLYNITFPYISASHVIVTVGGVTKTLGVDYTMPTSSTIQFSSAPAIGTKNIRITRNSSQNARLVDFQNGSTLTEADLDKDGNQAFYMAQEAFDSSGLITLAADGKLDAQSRSLKGVVAGSATGEVVIYDQLVAAQLSAAGISVPVPVLAGGTGATTAAAARTALGATSTGSAIFTAASGAAVLSLIGGAASGANTDITSLASPAIGAATATTQVSTDNTTKVATTAMVQSAITGAAANQTQVDAGTASNVFITPALNKITLQAVQATTSGTSKDFTGIPTGVRRIQLHLNKVSTNNTAVLRVQLGTGGVPTTSGYSGHFAGGATPTTFSAGFELDIGPNTSDALGTFTFHLVDSSTNTWMGNGIFAGVALANAMRWVSGVVSLSGVLNMVRLTTANGTDAFDAGSVSLSWEK